MSEVQAPALPHVTQKLMHIMDELTQLMEAEIPLIEKCNYDAQNLLIKRKHELTLDYNATLQSLAQATDKLDAGARAALKSKGKALDALAHRNAEAIRLAHSATDRLLQVMMHEIRKDLGRNSGYSAHGNIAAAEKATSQPVACNRSV